MQKKTVLVVDDEPEIRRALTMRLKSNGYSVLTAEDGMQATNIAIQCEPDLIILDIGMPGGDGFVVYERLRNSSRSCTIPIVFLTARAGVRDMLKAKEMGADRYITKPFKPEELLKVVSDLIA